MLPNSLEPVRASAWRVPLPSVPECWLSPDPMLRKEPMLATLPVRPRRAGRPTRMAAASAWYSLAIRDTGLAWMMGLASSRPWCSTTLAISDRSADPHASHVRVGGCGEAVGLRSKLWQAHAQPGSTQGSAP